MGLFKKVFRLGKQTFKEFSEDNCPRMAAALSYYTVFSLPPLFVLIIMIAGLFIEPGQIQGVVERQMSELLGPEGAAGVRTMIASTDRPGSGNVIAVIFSIAALVFSATGAFAQLQKALDTAWEVAPDPAKKNYLNIIAKRLLSLGMIVVIAFLLLVSLLLSTAVAAFGQVLSDYFSGGISHAVLIGLTFALSFSINILLFASILKVLPDAEVRWRDVWPGALLTAVLFELGKFLIGFYIARKDPGKTFGAAGSLAIILLWVYFSGLILFLGAEFTQVRARSLGREIKPKKGAVHIETTVIYRHGSGDE